MRQPPCMSPGSDSKAHICPRGARTTWRSSAPARPGYFAAASLLKFADSDDAADVRVDMLEMLPTPWGLVRSGVAPDHPKIKSISAQFEKTALDPRFRFFGNIVVGEHVQAAELAERYDAVIYAVGAQSDRSLNIPGEDLAGQRRRRRLRRLVQRAPALRGDGAGPVDRAGRRRRQRQRRAGRGAHPGHRPRRAGHHRHRRPRAEDRCTTAASRKCSSSAGAARCRPRSPRWSCASSATSRASATSTWSSTRPISPTSPTRTSRPRARPCKQQHQGAARLRRAATEARRSDGSCSGSARRRSRSRATDKVESIVLGRNELVADDSGRVVGQGHRRARGGARAAGGARGRLPRRADAGPAVRREERHHPAHRRPDRRQPQRVRRRLDQARADGRDRQQQERLAGDRRHAGRRSGRRASSPTSPTTIPRRSPSGWWSGSRSSSPTTTGS